MHAASRHGTPSLRSLPKDGGVSCFGRSSGRSPIQFLTAGTGWAAWQLTPLTRPVWCDVVWCGVVGWGGVGWMISSMFLFLGISLHCSTISFYDFRIIYRALLKGNFVAVKWAWLQRVASPVCGGWHHPGYNNISQ